MKITDIPEFHDKGELLFMTEKDTAYDAAREMREKKYSSVIVATKTKKMKGIFTERDLVNRVVAEGKDPKKVLLKDVMTTNVDTALVTDKVSDCMKRMADNAYRHMPIKDEKGNIAGILSQGDFVAMNWEQLMHQFKIQTKASFLSYTQIWMLVMAVIIYFIVMSATGNW